MVGSMLQLAVLRGLALNQGVARKGHSNQKVQEPISERSLPTPQLHLKFAKGDRVFNPKFGLGIVIVIKQYGGQIRELVIQFDYETDEKTFLVSAVQLT